MTEEQFKVIEDAYAKLNRALDRIKRQAKDVMRYPADERESLPYLINSVMDSAHEILDLAHEFKQAVRDAKKE